MITPRARQLSGCLNLVATFAAIAGTLLLLGCLFNLFPTIALVGRSASVSGTVERLVEADGSYFPVVSFQQSNGYPRVYTASVGTRPAQFTVGESVPILYDPDEPAEVRIDRFLYVWLIPVVLGGLTVAAWLIAGLATLAGRLLRRPRTAS